MVFVFSKLNHQKEIQPRKKKVPCSSFGTASRKKPTQCRLKDPIWRTFTHYINGEQAHVASQQKTKKERSSGLQSSWKGKENHVKCDSS
jgi:hypothetical protein